MPAVAPVNRCICSSTWAGDLEELLDTFQIRYLWVLLHNSNRVRVLQVRVWSSELVAFLQTHASESECALLTDWLPAYLQGAEMKNVHLIKSLTMQKSRAAQEDHICAYLPVKNMILDPSTQDFKCKYWDRPWMLQHYGDQQVCLNISASWRESERMAVSVPF